MARIRHFAAGATEICGALEGARSKFLNSNRGAMSETTYLVTGGAGFIGSALVRSLVGSGTGNVVNIDKLTYAGNSIRSIGWVVVP